MTYEELKQAAAVISHAKEMKYYSRKRFGRHVRRIRMARMLNEQEVADRADIKLATLQKIEAGKFNTPLDVMSRIATVLDCELRLVYVGQKD